MAPYNLLSYQSECHCAKTCDGVEYARLSLVTSQNVTAPKLSLVVQEVLIGLVTSQNVTAPKLDGRRVKARRCLVTSQNVTAPKQAVSLS